MCRVYIPRAHSLSVQDMWNVGLRLSGPGSTMRQGQQMPMWRDILEVTIKLLLPPDQTYFVFAGTPAQWFTDLKDVIEGDDIRKRAALRRQQAAKCLERQREGEVTILAPAIFNSATNWHRELEPRSPSQFTRRPGNRKRSSIREVSST